jgi:hypothetical protein
MDIGVQQTGALTFFAAAVAIGAQAWRAHREQQRMCCDWPRITGVVARADPRVETDSEGTTWSLRLAVETPGGTLIARDLLAQSDSGLKALAASHSPGTRVVLIRDPRHGTLHVDGHLPPEGAGWLAATAIGLLGAGLGAWFGLFERLGPWIAK